MRGSAAQARIGFVVAGWRLTPLPRHVAGGKVEQTIEWVSRTVKSLSQVISGGVVDGAHCLNIALLGDSGKKLPCFSVKYPLECV